MQAADSLLLLTTHEALLSTFGSKVLSVKSALTGIGKELDPKHMESVEKSRKALFRYPQTSSPGVPLVLFHGPPGSGKTQAMRVICAESKLTPYLLKTEKLPVQP